MYVCSDLNTWKIESWVKPKELDPNVLNILMSKVTSNGKPKSYGNFKVMGAIGDHNTSTPFSDSGHSTHALAHKHTKTHTYTHRPTTCKCELNVARKGVTQTPPAPPPAAAPPPHVLARGSRLGQRR